MFTDQIRTEDQLNYPIWLEDWWQNFTKERLNLSENQPFNELLEKEIQVLSDIFTVERKEHFNHYERQQNLLLAYGLFFFPQTFMRIRFLLLELLKKGWQPPQDRPLRVLDLGAGTGSTTLSLLSLFSMLDIAPSIEVMAVDHSKESLDILKKIHEDHSEHWQNTTLKCQKGDLRQKKIWYNYPQERWDIILASFSLNEAFYQTSLDEQVIWLKEAFAGLTPQGLFLILEPATPTNSKHLEALRDEMLDKYKAFVLTPCPHQAPCPLRKQGKYACHDVRSWNPPQTLIELNRKLHRRINYLKFSFLILSKNEYSLPSQKDYFFRVVSPISEDRGKFHLVGCFQDGELHQFEILKRHLSKEEQKKLRSLERGDIISFDHVDMIANEKIYRAKSFQDLSFL